MFMLLLTCYARSVAITEVENFTSQWNFFSHSTIRHHRKKIIDIFQQTFFPKILLTLSYACVNFTFHYYAHNLPSLFTYHCS